MKTQAIEKKTHLTYVYFFLPVRKPLGDYIAHKIEHQLLLSEDFSRVFGVKNNTWLQRNTFSNGMSFLGGIRLDFRILKEKLNLLLNIIGDIESMDLPFLPKKEELRLQKEIEEHSWDIHHEMASFYKKQWFLANKISIENITNEKVWKNFFDFSKTRLLIIGEKLAPKLSQSWSSICPFDLRKAPISTGVHFNSEEIPEAYSYSIFWGIENSVQNYVFARVLQKFLANELDKKYSQKGRAYNSYNTIWHDAIFSILETYIDTTDEKPQELFFKEEALEKDFSSLVESCMIDFLSEEDSLFYGDYVVIGLLPKDILRELQNISYNEFRNFFRKKIKELNIFWY